jgi:uncharacterized repeat protein (TIGR01451 family)
MQLFNLPITRIVIAFGLLFGSLLPAAAPRAQAATVLPNRTGSNGIYAYTDSTEAGGPAFVWNSVVGAGGVRLNMPSDDDSVNVTAPFPVQYFQLNTTQLRIGNNGGLQLGTASGSLSYSNASLDNVNTPNSLVAPFWDDFGLAPTPRGVYTATLGVAPNRRFVIQWQDMPLYGAANINTMLSFQVVFSEGSSDILFYYNDLNDDNSTQDADNGIAATVGIRGNTAAQALQYSFNEASLADGRAIRFYRLPPNITLSPATQYKQGLENTNVAYAVTLGNYTGSNETFNLSYTPGAGSFPISGPASVTVNDLASGVVNLIVAIPPGASAGSEDLGTLTAVAQSNPSLTASATVRTQAIVRTACVGLPATVSATPLTLPITVSNTLTPGRVTFQAAFSSAFTPADFRMELIDPVGTRVTLHNQTTSAMSGTYDLTRSADGPGALSDFVGTLGNGTWSLRITRRAGAFSSVTLSGCAINLLPAAAGIYLTPSSQTQMAAPGSSASYAFTMINNTASAQSIDLSYASSSGFAVNAPATVALAPNSAQSLQAQVLTEVSAPYLSTDVVTISATSAAGSDSGILKTVLAAPTWEMLPAMSAQRTSLAAASLSDGKIYAIGGQSGATAALASVEAYDPASNTWAAAPSMPAARRDIRATVLNNTIYVPGGYTGSATSNLMFAFNGTSWSQSPGTMNTAVNRAVVVSDPQTSRVLVFGGQAGFSSSSVTQAYTTTGSAWSVLAPLPVALDRAAGARIGRKVYISGGYSGSANTNLYIYNLDTNTWSTGPAAPGPQIEAGGVAAGSRFCMVGGSSALASPEIAVTACYDTVTNTWGNLPNLNAGRLQLGVTAGYSGGIYAVGGNDATAPYAASCPLIDANYRHCNTAERYAFSAATPARFAGSSKTVTPSSVTAGGLLTYTLTISNSGQLAGTAYLSDTLSANVTLESASAGLAYSPGTHTLTSGATTVSPQGTKTYAVVVRVNSNFIGALGNSFQLSGDGTLRTVSAPSVTVVGQFSADFSSTSADTLGQLTTFSASIAGGTGPYSYAWSFGDSTSASGAAAIRTHTYASAGSYNVILTVTDSTAQQATAQHQVLIVAAPTASLSSSGPDTLGQTTSFTATATGAGPLSYAWDFGDGSSGTGANPSHSYASAGTYAVTLTVTDGNGATATATGAVLIVAAISEYKIFLPLIVR